MGMFDLIKTLSDAEVDYVVVGGLAVVLHGYQRATMDVDVVLAMDENGHGSQQGRHRHRRAAQDPGGNQIMNAEQNFRLLREIDDHREFILAVYRQNPAHPGAVTLQARSDGAFGPSARVTVA